MDALYVLKPTGGEREIEERKLPFHNNISRRRHKQAGMQARERETRPDKKEFCKASRA